MGVGTAVHHVTLAKPVTGATRVALVEDHAVLADALRVSLAPQGFDVVSVPLPRGGDIRRQLLQSVIDAQPRVVLLDLDLGPAGDGSALVHPLTLTGQRVVVLTALRNPVRWGECLAQGALAVIPKVATLDTFVEVIRRVDQGLEALPRTEHDRLVGLWRERHSDAHEGRRLLGRLTAREAHVLGQLAQGKRVREVAEEFFVSEGTVRTHVKSILAKLGVNSQLAAVAMARDLGWTAPPDDPSEPGRSAPAPPDRHQ